MPVLATCIRTPLIPFATQVLAGLVRLSNNSRMTSHESLLSRNYGYVLLGRYVVELEMNLDLRVITFN